jgi:two-component system, LuxR family, response regulator FixJ
LAQTTVFIIDDDPAVRNSLKFALEVEGFAVRAYPAGADLLREREFPANGCLVVDYKLPEMNGLDLLVELRKRKIDLPAILITTHPSSEVRRRAALAGAMLIEKPLLNDTLFQGIRAALDGQADIARPTS